MWQRKCEKDDENVMKPYATKQIGNSSIAVSADDKVVAIGGWDGKSVIHSSIFPLYQPLDLREKARLFGEVVKLTTASLR